MKCYEVTITGFVITSDDDDPPDHWDWNALLNEFKHSAVAEAKVVLMSPENKKSKRKCGACGQPGHNRRKCLNA